MAVVWGVRLNSPLYSFSLAIITAPMAIVYSTSRVVARFRVLLSSVRPQFILLAKKAVSVATIGFVVVVFKAEYAAESFKSDNAMLLALATAAGVGAWLPAIEAHHLVKCRLHRYEYSARPQLQRKRKGVATWALVARFRSALTSVFGVIGTRRRSRR
ncbi:hypothetical protein [Amycolatopsis cihanbeyliensis]|uniref:Uncharacterized protein n=1 Tax=Amycolatopsis cihanbeyliensis TaxID=1128664 RepID=A0A542DNJ9_AMYCI|nr:hypothetical protein [Amycolatopsis cihanbeyliensis]TQJ04681.1 hypothetical protein FB471_4486 [Amycolatopsis cihanbeyliensis]